MTNSLEYDKGYIFENRLILAKTFYFLLIQNQHKNMCLLVVSQKILSNQEKTATPEITPFLSTIKFLLAFNIYQ